MLVTGKRLHRGPTASSSSPPPRSPGSSLDAKGVAIVGDVPTGLPSPRMPGVDASLVGAIAPTALTIAVVAYAEGVSVAKAIARRTREKVDADQELLATGASNLASGMFGGFPVAGGFSRTAVNHSAGARTPMASLVAAAVLTVAATLLVGVEPGLAIGLLFSLALFVHRSAHPHTTELGRVEGTATLRNVDRWPTRTCERIAVLRVDGPLFFASTRSLEERIAALLADRPQLDTVVVDASAIGDLDTTGAHLLSDLDEDLAESGVTLRLATVRGPVRDVIRRAGGWDRLADRIHPSVEAAVRAADPGSVLLHATPDERPTAVL